VSQRLAVGDVFLIPLEGTVATVGQIVSTYLSAYFLATFDEITETDSPLVDRPLASPVVFIALALDAKLALGHWPIVARRPVADDIPLPAFKESVGSSERIRVVDHSGTRHRPATPKEAGILRNRTIIAPAVLERAVRARLGLEPWLDAFDELIPDRACTTDRLFRAAEGRHGQARPGVGRVS